MSGRLTTAPRVAGIRAVDRNQLGLVPLAVTDWGHWVWVHPQPTATFPDHSELEARLAPTGWLDLEFAATRRWTLECRWKVYVDNYLDGGYHIPRLQAPGVSPTSGGAVSAWLWPACRLNRYGPCMDTNHVIPLGPDRCEVHTEFWFEPGADPAMTEQSRAEQSRAEQSRAEQSIEQAGVTQSEDVGTSESVQRGMLSGGWSEGR
ncbi:MAG: choline monooxygenase [Myxococcota bacterium]